jgi:metal-responsive CopG/Arc/MetJ family transcriptional regulator
MKKSKVSISIPSDLLEEIKREARNNYRTVSSVITEKLLKINGHTT